MEVEQPGRIVIPYGVEHCSMDRIERSVDPGGSVRFAAPFPCVVLVEATPLRLNNSDYDPAPPPAVGNEEPDLVSVLRDHVKLGCASWNRKAFDFVDGYFEAVEQALIRNQSDIASQAVGFGQLYHLRDWIYSALRPLPRAHVPARGHDGDGAGRLLVDFAFWTGRHFAVLDLGKGDLLPKQATERRQRLDRAGIAVFEHAPGSEEAWQSFLARLMPDGFWRGEVLPMGPFRSGALEMLDGRVAA